MTALFATANEAQTVTSATAPRQRTPRRRRRTRASTKISTASRRPTWVRPPPRAAIVLRREAATEEPTPVGQIIAGRGGAAPRLKLGRVRVHAFQEQRGERAATESAAGRRRGGPAQAGSGRRPYAAVATDWPTFVPTKAPHFGAHLRVGAGADQKTPSHNPTTASSTAALPSSPFPHACVRIRRAFTPLSPSLLRTSTRAASRRPPDRLSARPISRPARTPE